MAFDGLDSLSLSLVGAPWERSRSPEGRRVRRFTLVSIVAVWTLCTAAHMGNS
jgi:hypothetical protein